MAIDKIIDSAVDLDPKDRNTVVGILRKHVPNCEVRAYGSRVKWNAKQYSDLDLAVVGASSISPFALSDLREAFEESDLPFRVDVMDWDSMPKEFRSEVSRQNVVLQERRQTRLKDVAEIVMGQSPPGETVSYDNGFPLLNGPTEFGDQSPSPVQFTTDPRRFAIKGDILFCVRGSTTGRMNWADQDYAIGRGIAAIRHKEASHFQHFLRGAIEYHLPALLNQATGSTFPNVSRDQLRNLPFPDMPIETQEQVSSVLKALDDRTELNRRMCETLEEMASALFKAWFVDFEPVRAKIEGRWREGESLPGLPAHLYDLFPDGLVDSELGPVPYRWTIVPMGEIATTVYGAPFASTLFNDDQLGNPLIRIRDLATGNPSKWTKETHAKGHLVQPGEIVAGMDGEFRSYYWKGRSAWLNQRVCSFLPHSGISKVFLRETVEGLLHIEERSKEGTTVRHLGKSDIDKFKVVRPPSPVMERFQSMADALINNSVTQSQQTQLLGIARDTLLPKLISGEVRLLDAAGVTDC